MIKNFILQFSPTLLQPHALKSETIGPTAKEVFPQVLKCMLEESWGARLTLLSGPPHPGNGHLSRKNSSPQLQPKTKP